MATPSDYFFRIIRPIFVFYVCEHMKPLTLSLALILTLSLVACNRGASIKVKNSLSKTTIENLYWGDAYVGGALKPGEETEFFRVKAGEETLPNSNQIRFTVLNQGMQEFSTEQTYDLEKTQELFIELSDATLIYEI